MTLYHDPDQSRATPTLLPVGVVSPFLAAQADFDLEEFQMMAGIPDDAHVKCPAPRVGE